MPMGHMSKISVYGGFGFVLGEFCRQNLERTVRIPKTEIEPFTPIILYGISTVDNYNVFDNPLLDAETNIIKLLEVLDACHKKYGNKFEFNFVSSWFVYGSTPSSDSVPLTEGAYCNPTGFYSITKRAAEQLLISYCETFKIKYRILRLANVLGHRDTKVSAKKNALQYLVDNLVHNEDIELYDNGQFYRDYIDVRDCARAIALVMEKGQFGEIYNISNGKSQLFHDLIMYAKECSQSKSNVWEKLQKPEFHAVVQSKDVFLSNEKLRTLGYEPKFTIEETLRDIIDNAK
jgi:nucleoside-diphosphate-sugar epimerase